MRIVVLPDFKLSSFIKTVKVSTSYVDVCRLNSLFLRSLNPEIISHCRRLLNNFYFDKLLPLFGVVHQCPQWIQIVLAWSSGMTYS